MYYRFASSIAAVIVCLGFAQSVDAQTAASSGSKVPLVSTAAPALPVTTSVADSLIRYVGRWSFEIKDEAQCAWPASEVDLRFVGSSIDIVLTDTGNNLYEVIVDGVPAEVLRPESGAGLYSLYSSNSSSRHTVQIVKRTESFFGIPLIQGFQISAGGRLLPLPKPSGRRLEVIGDSISCGYGNEGKNQNEKFSADTENAYLTYGAVAARAVGAEYTCIAWSGKKMWPDNTIPELYDRTLSTIPTSHCDLSAWNPQAILINLATNDFGPTVPDKAGWIGGFEAFIAHLRQFYPRSVIYAASGPMMYGASLDTLKTYLAQIVADEAAKGDKSIHEIDFGTQDISANGIGADWHPSVKTHRIMAQVFESALRKDLGWNEVAQK